MVDDLDAERGAEIAHPRGFPPVLLAGRRDSRGVVVRKQDPPRTELERPRHHRTNGEVELTFSANAHDLACKKTAICIAEDDHEDFAFTAPQSERQISLHLWRSRIDTFASDNRFRCEVGQVTGCDNQRADRGIVVESIKNGGVRGRQQPSRRTETADQALRR